MFKALCYQTGGTTYTLQITDVFYIPLTPWCGLWLDCSNHVFKALCYQTGGTTYTLQITDVFYIPLTLWLDCSNHVFKALCYQAGGTTYTLQITDVFYIPLTPWLDSNHVFKALCHQAGGTTYTLQITDVFYIPLTPSNHGCGPLQSCVQGTVLSQAGGTTYTLQITDVFYIPLTPWCGPLQSCVQGTVLSGRRHYLHTADNRCILHTSNTLGGPLQSCVQGTVLSQEALYTLTDVFYIPLTLWLDCSNHVFKALCYQTGGTTYTLQITDVFYIPLTPWCGPLQSCVQGTVLSDRRHYLHTADNRCILHTSNTLVRTAPIMCSRHCVIRQEALLTYCR